MHAGRKTLCRHAAGICAVANTASRQNPMAAGHAVYTQLDREVPLEIKE
jgi:hypothetical protein